MVPPKAIKDLLSHAKRARKKARHYNKFRVGATAWFPKAGGKIGIFKGANTKKTPETPKDCAEMKIFRAANRRKKILDGIVVVGVPRAEDTAPTLHPCEECRRQIRHYLATGRVVREDTYVICVNAETAFVEIFTVRSLIEAHGEELIDD